MSHTMNIKTEMRDPAAIAAAAEILKVPVQQGTFDLYSTKQIKGTALYLQGWMYPAVIREDGTVFLDNYGGRWGDEKKLTEFMAHYGREKTKAEALAQGYTFMESYNEDTKELELEIIVEN